MKSRKSINLNIMNSILIKQLFKINATIRTVESRNSESLIFKYSCRKQISLKLKLRLAPKLFFLLRLISPLWLWCHYQVLCKQNNYVQCPSLLCYMSFLSRAKVNVNESPSFITYCSVVDQFLFQ